MGVVFLSGVACCSTVEFDLHFLRQTFIVCSQDRQNFIPSKVIRNIAAF